MSRQVLIVNGTQVKPWKGQEEPKLGPKTSTNKVHNSTGVGYPRHVGLRQQWVLGGRAKGNVEWKGSASTRSDGDRGKKRAVVKGVKFRPNLKGNQDRGELRVTLRKSTIRVGPKGKRRFTGS